MTRDVLGAELRREPRYEVLIAVLGRAASHPVKLANVNESGCLVYASCRLFEGVVYTFQFYVAPHFGEVKVDARVVHAEEVTGRPDTVCAAGVEFVGESAQQKAAIERLIAGAAG